MIRNLSLNLFLPIGIILFLSSGSLFAQTFGQTECSCLNNATTATNGQYSESIIILSNPGETWTIVSSTGFFSVSSPAPPGSPVPYINGTVIPADAGSSSTYILNGIRVSGFGWNVVLSNGSQQFVRSSNNMCTYPTTAQTTIVGDFGVCLNDVRTYRINVAPGLSSGIVWSIGGGAGTIVSGQGTPQVVINWGASTGNRILNVTGLLRSYPSQSDPCTFTSSSNVAILSPLAEVIACNNLVNVSMNPSCEMFLTPDMILQDMRYNNDSYELELRDLQNDTIIPLGTLGYNYINRTLRVRVIQDCSGNSCWGYVRIEDKSIPALSCPDSIAVNCDQLTDPFSIGFPFGPSFSNSNITNIGGGRYKVVNFDPCSDVTIQYEDKVAFNQCVGPYSSVITRTWVVIDNSGNTDVCSQVININRANLADVTFPPNYDDILGTQPSLVACSNYLKLPADHLYAGNPHPDFTGRPMGVVCLSAHVDFADTKLPICGTNSYKILRRWTIFDHCNGGSTRNHTQTIAVMDNNPPNIVAPADFTVGTASHVCGGQINIPAPILLTPECSAWDYTISYRLQDESGNYNNIATTAGVVRLANGLYRINEVITVQPKIQIIYTATDACGNIKVVTNEVSIRDTEQPIPVCDRNSIVAVGEDGMAFVGVKTFDDGSWDNCGLDRMEVARMNPSSCTNTLFGQEVKFCCSDVGASIQIILRVWDKSNNSNECMVLAEVQDNIAPKFTSVPGPRTANCTEDFTNLTRFGTPTATDNCNANITYGRTDLLDDCGVGTIIRTFTVTDNQGNSTTAQQVITVSRLTPFVRNDIRFPADAMNVQGCTNGTVRPEDLPADRRRPTWTPKACSQVPEAVYEDIVFQYTSEACVKILRKWTVIDWCQRNPLIPGSGTWEAYQVIMVNNNVAPTILKGCSPSDLIITNVGVCQSNVEITAIAEDDCTPENKLVWTHAIDVNNDGGTPEFTGNTRTINRTLPYGTHKITWTVKDECGNIRTCTNIFTLDDTKKPTPYCLTEIVTVIMPTSKNVTIWASDFDLGSTDNCSSVTASFHPSNRNDISRTITCADMTAKTTPITYNVHFIDAKGNSDFCTVILHVQDNNNACGFGITNNPENQLVFLSGNIYNQGTNEIPNVEVQLISNQPEFPIIHKTGADGKFIFESLKKLQDYTISPSLNIDPLNGVSTLDLVLIQRHILGIEVLDSPYKLIAADVNKSNSINTTDLVELRKVILGINTNFTNNQSWRFMETSHNFSDPTHPYHFPSTMTMNNLGHDVAGIDFMGIKVGDVNNSAKLGLLNNTAENRNTLSLIQNTVTGIAGNIVEIEIKADQIQSVVGMQMSLFLPTDLAQILEIDAKALGLNDDNIALNQLESGLINISWNQINPSDLTDKIITIKLKLRKDVNAQAMFSLVNNTIQPEIYVLEDNQVKPLSIRLTEADGNNSSAQFELYQNIPNPFNDKTSISFSLPTESNITLTIFDINGKSVYQRKGKYEKGRHSIEVDNSFIEVGGLLYYKLDTDKDSATRKMIVIK